MNLNSRKFEEMEQEVNGRPNVFTGFNLPDTFEDYINCVKMEKRNELVWKFHGNEEQILKAYSEWLEEEFKGFNVIDLNAQDPTDELYPEYVRAAGFGELFDESSLSDSESVELLKDFVNGYLWVTCEEKGLNFLEYENGDVIVWDKEVGCDFPNQFAYGIRHHKEKKMFEMTKING